MEYFQLLVQSFFGEIYAIDDIRKRLHRFHDQVAYQTLLFQDDKGAHKR